LEVSGDLEVDLSNLYQAQLQAADQNVTVKRVPLKFSTSDRTIYYLFFTTHDPTGALELNEQLDKAKLWELGLRWNLRQDRYVSREMSSGQQSFFDFDTLKSFMPSPPSAEQRSVNIERLAQDIYAQWSQAIPTRKVIYRWLVDTTLYSSEIDQALTWLKRHGYADFDSRKVHEPIRFLKKGSP
jgi:hypothetical protein